MENVEFIAIMYEGVNSQKVREDIESVVFNFTCTEIRNVPLPYLAGYAPINAYKKLFKVESVENDKPNIPKFLEGKVEFLEFKGLFNVI